MRPYTVRYSDSAVLAEAGFGKVAHLPFILDGRPGYHRLGSEYLIDRGLGVWHPRVRQTNVPATPPTDITIQNYAHWLANFLEWAEKRSVDLPTCSYGDHVHGRYQPELISGMWSRDGKGLAATTVNLYVQQACDFLNWMSFKGKRDAFHVPVTTATAGAGSATSSRGHKGFEVEIREGKVRQPKRRLRMPTDAEVRDWLSRVHDSQGATKGLMCETVLLTALRRTEVACFRTDTLPLDPADWHVSNPTAEVADQLILLAVKFGTKGKSYGKDHGDKVGPVRHIGIPLHLATRLHEYREKTRPRLLSTWVKAVRGAVAQKQRRDEAVHLFLDEATGERITGSQLYEAWTAVALPYKGWCPHLGRDWWACSTLWREVKLHEHVLKLGKNAPGALLAAVATDIIRLKIQPQLGHKRESTCFIYLQWISDMLGVALPEQYQHYLDSFDEDESTAE